MKKQTSIEIIPTVNSIIRLTDAYNIAKRAVIAIKLINKGCLLLTELPFLFLYGSIILNNVPI
jgi:hypothetical protein